MYYGVVAETKIPSGGEMLKGLPIVLLCAAVGWVIDRSVGSPGFGGVLGFIVGATLVALKH